MELTNGSENNCSSIWPSSWPNPQSHGNLQIEDIRATAHETSTYWIYWLEPPLLGLTWGQTVYILDE